MDREHLDMGTARIAAELRLHLAQMTAASQLLAATAADEKSRRYLAALDQSVCRMLRVVGRMELSARLGEAERPELAWTSADLSRLTRDLGERLEGLLRCAGVELTVAVPERLPARVDEGLIRQIILELTANAARAGKHVSLTLERRGETAVFTVEDDGPGIPPERLQYLFSGQEESLPDWRRGGVGVAVARRAAQLHGGTVLARCVPGRGLRVAASIPLGRPEDGRAEEPALAWDRGGFDEAVIALSGLLPASAFELEDET